MERNFKRVLSVLLAVAVCVGMIPSALAAYSPTEATAAAEKLASLSLFMGTSDDAANPQFELDRAPTRGEALVIFVRLLGMEDTVLDPDGDWASRPSPFTDVPDWLAPYAAYCYEKGYVKGIGNNEYDPDATITASQMLTFVLRALDHTNLDVAISPSRFSRHGDLAASGEFKVTVLVYGFVGLWWCQ